MSAIASPPRPVRKEERPAPRHTVVSTAERSECTCPEFCERDHDRD